MPTEPEIETFADMESCMAAKMADGMSEEEAHDACMAAMEEEPMMASKDRAAGKYERRFTSNDACEVRVEERDGQSRLSGYAAVFHIPGDDSTEYKLFDDLTERIMPRAFNKALQDKHDVRALFNHDPSLILGRVGSGTLRLSKDQKGLKYTIDPPAARSDVVEAIRRGDVTGSSFGFQVTEQKFRSEGTMDVREIHSVRLLDVSPTTYPAYGGTSVGVRAAGDIEEVRAAYTAWKRERAALDERLAAIKRRADEISP